ncbi:ATP-dependent protease LonB [Caldicoprobacter algeriensis]|uniref:ATP-dependent protease LonB n=1 Tax=Caldicoprobacter algeriensis TaxID=699281 RepID=UPI0020796733|nr:ATP-dependent protease LonB [Caldicoprobacter algeriensis]MCM8900098.1 ATP-dependent protease LonB [Caldicoprobacter algeriensis]
MLGSAVIIIQLFFAIIIGLYFLNLLKSQQGNKIAVEKESKKELENLQRLREISLTEPLAEKTRPTSFEEIIGQEEGIKALRAALCGPNPQHVIIYGPPGVGKTCAARLVLEEAKKNPRSPFRADAKFIEMDATSIRFDERSIADPLIGSVHDPIYQGAGPLGIAGIPQPKPGAVTKAHGGVLFLDEIGELHPIQMNKLLKVLEDRKVFFESAYYSSYDTNIPRHIHEIFQKGLPADFRLIGATTRSPSEIPAAIRSRCLEIFFRELRPDEIMQIAKNAAKKGGFSIAERAVELVGKYAGNGRDAVNIIQLAGGLALTEGRTDITVEDIEWVINSGHYSPRPEKKVQGTPRVGCVNGLAVYGAYLGTVMEVEVSAMPAGKGKGMVTVTGIIDEEEMGSEGKRMRRKSTARDSVENVLTAVRKWLGVNPRDYDIHLNFPGGIPVDGPSAGIAMAVAVYSAITGQPVDGRVAMTGEVSILGVVKPVGGIAAKIEAAVQAGVKKVIIPMENWQETFKNYSISIVPVERIEQVIEHAMYHGEDDASITNVPHQAGLLSASAK